MPAGDGTAVGAGRLGTSVSKELMVSVSVPSMPTGGVREGTMPLETDVAVGAAGGGPLRSQPTSKSAASPETAAIAAQKPNRPSRPESTVRTSTPRIMQRAYAAALLYTIRGKCYRPTGTYICHQ